MDNGLPVDRRAKMTDELRVQAYRVFRDALEDVDAQWIDNAQTHHPDVQKLAWATYCDDGVFEDFTIVNRRQPQDIFEALVLHAAFMHGTQARESWRLLQKRKAS